MSELFIKEIEIKNYKLFKEFKAQGFGRVNLIGGKNNVGKSAFMEACYINVASKDIEKFSTAMSSIKFARENLNILYEDIKYDNKEFLKYFNKFYSKSNLNKVYFGIINNDGIHYYFFKINDKEKKINIKDFYFNDKYNEHIEFIDSYGFAYYHIKDAYSYVQKKDKENYLNNTLHNFDKQLKSFKIIDNIPMCKVEDKYIELTELGDGTRHLISFVSSLYKCENGYLFIDEIENGIHYTNFDKLWEIILTISKEQNVQVFATTHSIECIQSYARVAKKLLEDKKIDKEDIAFIEMGINKYNKPRAIVMDSERFFRELEIGNEVRGW